MSYTTAVLENPSEGDVKAALRSVEFLVGQCSCRLSEARI